MANVYGQRQFDSGTQTLQVFDISRDIVYLNPIETPLYSMLMLSNSRIQTISPDFRVAEMNYLNISSTISGAHLASATTLNITDATWIQVGDLLRIDLSTLAIEENVLVTAINSTTQIVVTRDVGGTGTGGALSGGEEIRLAGNSTYEGGNPADSLDSDYAAITNYVEEFSTSLSDSDLQALSTGVPGSERAMTQARKGAEHKRKIEAAYFFGKASKTVVGGKNYYTTCGLVKRIQTNRNPINTTISKATFDAACAAPFRNGSQSKVLFCGDGMFSAIHYWAGQKLIYEPTAYAGEDGKTFGFSLQKYLSPYGEIQLVRHRLFVGAYAGLAVLVDMSLLKDRYMKDTELRTNIQDNKQHGFMDEWRTISGLETRNESSHALWIGVTGGA